MSDRQSNTRSALVTAAARWLALPLSIASGAVIARLLGPEGRGLVAWVILLPSFTASLSSMGLSSSLTYVTRSAGATLSQAFSTSLLLALLLGSGAAVALYASFEAEWIPRKGASPAVVSLMLVTIPMVLAALYANAALVTQQLFVQ